MDKSRELFEQLIKVLLLAYFSAKNSKEHSFKEYAYSKQENLSYAIKSSDFIFYATEALYYSNFNSLKKSEIKKLFTLFNIFADELLEAYTINYLKQRHSIEKNLKNTLNFLYLIQKIKSLSHF